MEIFDPARHVEHYEELIEFARKAHIIQGKDPKHFDPEALFFDPSAIHTLHKYLNYNEFSLEKAWAHKKDLDHIKLAAAQAEAIHKGQYVEKDFRENDFPYAPADGDDQYEEDKIFDPFLFEFEDYQVDLDDYFQFERYENEREVGEYYHKTRKAFARTRQVKEIVHQTKMSRRAKLLEQYANAPIKALILAAGYGTRLERDILADEKGTYDHLRGVPKPLVPVGDKPLIDYWIESLTKAGIRMEHIYVVCNGKNFPMFCEWAQKRGFPIENIYNDKSIDNQSRVGAIKDISLAVDYFGIKDSHSHLMIIGGDTLFHEDFSLRDIMDHFYELQDKSMVLWYFDEDTTKTGILETDDNDMVVDFLEKPQPTETNSRQACPCFYIYHSSHLHLINTYVREATSLEMVDAPGRLLVFVHQQVPVIAHEVSGRFDIGGLDSYIACNDTFNEKVEEQQRELTRNRRNAQASIYACVLLASARIAYGLIKPLWKSRK